MPLPTFVREAIRWLYAVILAHQYVVLFAVVAIEEAGLPLPAPSDVVIAFYGYRARDEPSALAQVVLVCALASTAGTLLPYFLARRFGVRLARRFARLFDVDDALMDRWTARIQRNGFGAVFVGRLIPGARVAMSVVAGAAGVPLREFSPAVFAAASVYWSIWVAIGVTFGPAVREIIGPAYIRLVLIALPLAVITLFVVRFVRARRRADPGVGG